MTPRFTKAITLAAEAHEGQERKGTGRILIIRKELEMENNSKDAPEKTGNGYEYDCDGGKPSESYMKWMAEKAKEYATKQDGVANQKQAHPT